MRVGGVDVRNYDLESPARRRWPWCCRRTCSSPARSRKTCAGATRTPPTRRWCEACTLAQRGRVHPAASRTATTPASSRAARTSPAARSSACASPARCSKSPKMLILDDSTSAVDTATDALIRKALARRTSPARPRSSLPSAFPPCRTRTSIIVHGRRPRSTAFGTHEELLQDQRDLPRGLRQSQAGSGSGDVDEAAMK